MQLTLAVLADEMRNVDEKLVAVDSTMQWPVVSWSVVGPMVTTVCILMGQSLTARFTTTNGLSDAYLWDLWRSWVIHGSPLGLVTVLGYPAVTCDDPGLSIGHLWGLWRSWVIQRSPLGLVTVLGYPAVTSGTCDCPGLSSGHLWDLWLSWLR